MSNYRKSPMYYADIAFSNAIRIRARWKCENPHCERDCSDEHGQLHCAHIMARRHQATRYDPDNCVALCVECHGKFDSSTEFRANVLEQIMDPFTLDQINQHAHQPFKRFKSDYPEIARHYRRQAKMMYSFWAQEPPEDSHGRLEMYPPRIADA